MNLQKLNSRSPSLDIIRIIAVIGVLSVHFFLHSGFYSQPMQGTEMYLFFTIRTLFSICVPLFIILTGYLMCKKTLSKKYYFGISKTLIIFVLASIACIIFKSIFNNTDITFNNMLFSVLDFSGANYSWYVEMYIGLFLLAPFLNVAYNKLESKKRKNVLMLTLFVLAILPSILNVYNFESLQWWTDPTSSNNFQKIFPDWWTDIYPIAYYFVGCYLREYGLKFRTRSLWVLFICALIVFSSFNFFRSYPAAFKGGPFMDWSGVEPYVLSILLFELIRRINLDNIPSVAKLILYKISDWSFGVYLLSYIFDEIVYTMLKESVPVITERLPYFFVTVPIVFICSIIAAAVIDVIARLIIKMIKSIYKYVTDLKENAPRMVVQDYVFVAFIVGAILFAFWKCQYGFGGSDEAFYLTIPHRLTLGDALIKDEWHLSQLSGFLIFPFVKLYTLIVQSTDGIIFAARIAYIFMHLSSSVFIYTKLRKYGYMSVFACVLFFLFTPFDIMALSYNTMGLEAVAVSGVLMATADFNKKIPLVAGGVIFAAGVLCCPYLAVVYILFILCVIVGVVLKKHDKLNNIFASDLFAWKTFLWFTVGVAGLAAVFLIYIFTTIGINDIFVNLPYMLSDPEHPQIALSKKIVMYFDAIINCVEHFIIPLCAYLVMLVAMITDRKRKNHRAVYLILTCAVTVVTYVLFLPQLISTNFNAIMFPMIFLGITSYILIDNKPKKLFAALFIVGILYSVSICFTSNQYFYVISMAVSASNIASFIFLGILVKEIKESQIEIYAYSNICKAISIVFVLCTVFLQGVFQIVSKANHCFWDSEPQLLTEEISCGPASGIHTTADKKQTYESIYNDLKQFTTNFEGNILCLTGKTWCYLAANNMNYATFSAWISGENIASIERLKEFYAVNPDKVPNYIYIPKESKWEFASLYADAQEAGYIVNQTAVGYRLSKIN